MEKFKRLKQEYSLKSSVPSQTSPEFRSKNIERKPQNKDILEKNLVRSLEKRRQNLNEKIKNVQERMNKLRFNSPVIIKKSVRISQNDSSKSRSPNNDTNINYYKSRDKTAFSKSMNNTKNVFPKSNPQELYNVDEKLLKKFNKLTKTYTLPVSLGKTDYRNLKKLEKLKEYDQGVKNFSNIEKIFPELPLIENELDNNSEEIDEIKANEKMIQDEKEDSNNHILTDENEINNLNFNLINGKSIMIPSNSSFNNFRSLIGSKASEKLKNKLYSIYKTNPEEETQLRQIKCNKNMDLEQYQRNLFLALKNKISPENLLKLSVKFREIQNCAGNSKKLPPFNINEELNLEEYKEALATVGCRTNYRMKKIIQPYNNQQINNSKKRKNPRKDPTLEKISFILPDFLMRKLEANF